jgi:hypothetical protein
LKIWRYMDLAKFVHMLATGTLYFPCITELKDPYEGWLPRSHIKALRQLNRPILDDLKTTLDSIAARDPARDRGSLDDIQKKTQRDLNPRVVLRKVNRMFGVNCWHINEHESEAMWQLYTVAGQGVAIESTKARLEGALRGDGITVDQVRYEDFSSAKIEKGHKRYAGFLKRKSFAHEQELRATIRLPTLGVGTAVPCDLNALITQIHVFPKAPSYYAEAVRYAVSQAKPEIKAPVIVSRLLDPPNRRVTSRAPRSR